MQPNFERLAAIQFGLAFRLTGVILLDRVFGGSRSGPGLLGEKQARLRRWQLDSFGIGWVLACVLFMLWVTQQSASAEPPIRNVLLLVSDDLKASVLGCYGDPVCRTPNLDRLAQQGMVFERAYCQGVWCAPSRESFMHSRYGGKANVNLGEHLRDGGWYSARVGKIYHMRVPGDIIDGTDGLDEPTTWTERFNSQGEEAHSAGDYACLNLNVFTDAPENRQSTRMPHRMFVSVEIDGDGSQQPDHKSATKAIELLEQHHDEPFFLAVGFVRPHYPMVAPRDYFARYPWQQISLPHVPPQDLDDIPVLGLGPTLSTKNRIGKYPDNQKRMWSAYYASVSFMDAQVGRILERLDQLGLRDSTAIVFTSDHGYHLGEHHMWQKSNLHEEVTRVPLIIDAPGYAAGRTRSIAELVDMYPTVCELLGVDVPTATQGKSLAPILTDATSVVRSEALSLNKGAALRDENWAYMKYQDGTSELYDMRADPGQFENLSGRAELESIEKKLSKRLEQRLSAAGLGSSGSPR